MDLATERPRMCHQREPKPRQGQIEGKAGGRWPTSPPFATKPPPGVAARTTSLSAFGPITATLPCAAGEKGSVPFSLRSSTIELRAGMGRIGAERGPKVTTKQHVVAFTETLSSPVLADLSGGQAQGGSCCRWSQDPNPPRGPATAKQIMANETEGQDKKHRVWVLLIRVEDL